MLHGVYIEIIRVLYNKMLRFVYDEMFPSVLRGKLSSYS